MTDRATTTTATGTGTRISMWITAAAVVVLTATGCVFGGDAVSEEAAVPPPPMADDAEFAGCYECHEDIDAKRSTEMRTTVAMDHAQHDLVAGDVVLGCNTCHPVNTHVGTTTISPTMGTCFDCHGASAEYPLGCHDCHPLEALPLPFSHQNDDWGSAHGIPLLEPEESCETCHARDDSCETCHGVEMPHPDGYEDVHVDEWEAEGSDTCNTCHSVDYHGGARSDCDACHHPGGDLGETWFTAHGSVVVAEGAEDCQACHSQEQFCTACHGIELPHPAGWTGTDHALAYINGDTEVCADCHDSTGETSKRTECDACHHPSGDPRVPWIRAHRDALGDGSGQCFTCHVNATCIECHTTGSTDFQSDWDRVLELSG